MHYLFIFSSKFFRLARFTSHCEYPFPNLASFSFLFLTFKRKTQRQRERETDREIDREIERERERERTIERCFLEEKDKERS